MALGISRRQRGLADAAQPMQRRDGDTAFVALERGLDICKRIVAPHEMGRHPNRDIGDGENRAGKRDGAGRHRRRHKFTKTGTRSFLGNAEKLAAANVIAERRQIARVHDHRKSETRPLRRRLPLRGPAFDGRIGRLDIVQIVVRHHAEHVIGGLMAPFHPGVNIVAGLDLPFVNVMRVAKGFQFLGDPECPGAVGLRIADKDVGHAHRPRVGPPLAAITETA
jgi:hypothetical protein